MRTLKRTLLDQPHQVSVDVLGFRLHPVEVLVVQVQERRERYDVAHCLVVVPVVVEFVQPVRCLLRLRDVQECVLGLLLLLLGVGGQVPLRDVGEAPLRDIGEALPLHPLQVDVLDQNLDALLEEDIEIVEILQQLEVHVEDFVVGDVVSAHFVEHLLGLQDEIHQVDDPEPMGHHLNLIAAPHLHVKAEPPHVIVRLTVHADLLQVQKIE